MYAKDISRKIRSSKKTLAQQGKFANSRAPYGYLKSPEDRHKLIVDENVVDNVKRMFNLFLHGKSGRYIADMFNQENIPTPNDYYYSLLKKPNPYLNSKNCWCSGSIMNILKNPVYYGSMVQGKRSVRSYKNKQVSINPKDDWIIVDNTHEAIIPKATWDEVQGLIKKNHVGIRRNATGDVSLFSGILKCADCGSKMSYDCRNYKSYVKEYYRCSTYLGKGKTACSKHTILLDTLYKAVLVDLQKLAKLAKDDETELINRLLEINSQSQERSVGRCEKQIREKERRLKEIDSLVQSLFEEKVSGSVPENTFKRMAKKYDDEQLTLYDELDCLNKELLECRKTENDVIGWTEKIKKFLSIDELTRAMVVELIDSIEVSEVYEIGGEKHQDFKINYKFAKGYDLYEKRAV